MPKLSSELPDTQITPEPSLEKRTRRIFASAYKLRILAEANTCKHGELGALLRRVNLVHCYAVRNSTVLNFPSGVESSPTRVLPD